MQRVRPAELRRRRLAARRPNRWLTEPCPAADQEIIDHADWRMSIVDGMSAKWRALVNHYGFQKTYVMYDSGMTEDAAWMALEAGRESAQKAWLNTDYFIGSNRRVQKRIVI